MDRFLRILKEKQSVPEEIVDEEKLRFIVSKSQSRIFLGYLKLTIWHFLRMKNRECSTTTIRNCMRLLFEIFTLSGVSCMCSDLFFSGYFF